ncbi:MAG: hypothetical protein IJS20_02500 [Bacteroidales bacterium]|nr:hypothetical protein [Bacteroidales bacterium]
MKGNPQNIDLESKRKQLQTTAFSLKHLDAVVGKQSFDMLVKDGVCFFEQFEKNIEKQYTSEIKQLYSEMNDIANLKALPLTKFHPYSDGKDGCREFEFKTKHLRAYAIEQPGGKIIILGGTKANQAKDQAEFWKYKKQYINSKQK